MVDITGELMSNIDRIFNMCYDIRSRTIPMCIFLSHIDEANYAQLSLIPELEKNVGSHVYYAPLFGTEAETPKAEYNILIPITYIYQTVRSTVSE